MMKKKVGRVEAIVIMRAAREFREKQAVITTTEPEVVTVPEVITPVVQSKKSFISYVIDFFRKKGS